MRLVTSINMPGKRKHLSVQQKMHVVELHDRGLKCAEIAEEMQCGKTQIYTILADKDKIKAVAENDARDESKPSKTRKLGTKFNDSIQGDGGISSNVCEACTTKEENNPETSPNGIISTRTALNYLEAIRYRGLQTGDTKLCNIANKGYDLVSDLRVKSLAKEHGISKNPSSDVPLSFLLLQHLMGGQDWDWDEYVNCDRDIDPENPNIDYDDDAQDDDNEDDDPPKPIITAKTTLQYLEQIRSLALNIDNQKLLEIISVGIKIMKICDIRCMKQTTLEDFFAK